MTRPAGRRKVRKRKAKTENSGVKLGVIAGIMLLAVFLGFLTARFVIGPIIGYNADESEISIAGEKQGDITESEREEAKDAGSSDVVNAEPSEGYALQFGAFSTMESAQKMADILKEKGIETKIVEADEAYKVISPVTESKEAALQSLEEAKEKEVTDVFIASFQ